MRSDDSIDKCLRLPTDTCGHCGTKYFSSVLCSFLLNSFLLYISDMIHMNQFIVASEGISNIVVQFFSS